MRVVALCSWYDEKPSHLAGLVASLSGVADHIVAVDGAYALYPRGRAHSPSGQADTIRETARSLGIGCTIHEPQITWQGQEVEKRNFMFHLAERMTTNDDWYLILDGDSLVTQVGYSLRDVLAQTEHDVAEVTMWRYREHFEPHERPFVTDAIEETPFRSMFRAIRGLSVVGRHYHYLTPDGRFLWGDGNVTPALSLPAMRLQHRNEARDLWRAKAAKTYYDTRDKLGVEGLTR